MHNLIMYLLKWITVILLKLVKPHQERSVFIGYPSYDDMLRGLLPYISHLQVIVLIDGDEKMPHWLIGDNIIVVKKKSCKAFYYLISAKVVYFTHGIFSFYPLPSEKRQKLINLWHGMPLKKIGYLDGKDHVPNCHVSIATSEFFEEIISKAFGLPKEKVLVTGLPRNELLLQQSKNDQLIKIRHRYHKIVCWLPTYRKSKVGDIRSDGDKSLIMASDLEKLSDLFLKNKSLLIIKPHPMDAVNYEHINLSNVMVMSSESLNVWQTSLYELLSITDSLWTDYSSVFVDYFVTGKPMVFITSDINSYSQNRGFTYSVEQFPLPGRQVNSIDELFDLPFNELFEVTNQGGNIYHDVLGFDARLLLEYVNSDNYISLVKDNNAIT